MQGYEDDKWLELVTEFEKEFGRLPTIIDMYILGEAMESGDTDGK